MTDAIKVLLQQKKKVIKEYEQKLKRIDKRLRRAQNKCDHDGIKDNGSGIIFCPKCTKPIGHPMPGGGIWKGRKI